MIYTVDINDVPIAAYGDVASDEDAAAFFARTSFLQGLAGLQSPDAPGVPLYEDGTEMEVRPAAPREIEIWRNTLAEKIAAGEAGEEEPLGVFLEEFEALQAGEDDEID